MDKVFIRKAKGSDAERITEVAYTSKASWGYPESWLDLWESDLKVTPEAIQKNPGWVITESEKISGYCRIDREKDVLEIEHMWILPECMGKGMGKKLLNYAIEQSVNKEITKIIVVSDPNAVEFYGKLGFVQSGWEKSSPGERQLPVLTASVN